MKKRSVKFYETAKGELPKQSDVVLAWTQLLSAERCKYLDDKFYMGNGKKWLDIPLIGVVYWCELQQFKELEW